MKTKVCIKCKKQKSLSDFYKNKKYKDGIFPYCKNCDKERKRKLYHNNPKIKKQQKKWRDNNKDKTTLYNWKHKIKRLYGLTTKQWEIKFNGQKGCCMICGIHQNELKSKLSVDHNHVTGKVRDLLCHRCNLLVGQFELNPGLLDTIAEYLERHNA